MTDTRISDPGTAIGAALETVRSDRDDAESVWIRFVNGDYARIGRTPTGWRMECDCGIRLEAESLSVQAGPEVVLTASSIRHPVVFRMAFLPASVDDVFLCSSDGSIDPLLEVTA